MTPGLAERGQGENNRKFNPSDVGMSSDKCMMAGVVIKPVEPTKPVAPEPIKTTVPEAAKIVPLEKREPGGKPNPDSIYFLNDWLNLVHEE